MERKTILLVDDNPSNLKLLVDCLESHDFRVAVASNGEEALRRLQRTHLAAPDLILLDIMMPGIDGYETCRQIKLIPEVSDIPIIFLSALSETPDKVYGFSAGGVDYITKPINLAEMIARINTHLELSGLRKELDARVQRRTRELLDANAALRREIRERFQLGAGIGVAVYPDGGSDADPLMRSAGSAKQSGRAEIRRHMDDSNESAHGHFNLSSLLMEAIEARELFMEFQPQIDLAAGHIIGAEALMRWRRHDGAWISPAEFIPVAEANGQIEALGEWGFRQSCAQLKRWHDAGYNDLGMSVNISVPQLHSAGFVDTVRRVIEEYRLPPSRLELEITESLLMQHSRINLDILHRLSDVGVRLSVDDFGTGYSSLAYLHDFPLDRLKIDISFVRNIGSERGNAIPSAIIAMAHSLNLNVVAEGVESDVQEAFLRTLGCEYAQGFRYSRSVSGDTFLALCRTGFANTQ